MDGRRLLGIYLNDHLAGAAAGRELAARSLRHNRGTRYGDELAGILPEIEQDARSLREIMRRVGASPDVLKQAGALVAERIGRLKLNGRLLGYSPLSRVVELEGLLMGARGKLAMWEALAALSLPELADMPLDALIERATSQVERLEELRIAAVREAVPT
jgi:hypothetical protein